MKQKVSNDVDRAWLAERLEEHRVHLRAVGHPMTLCHEGAEI
jgi:hypothetical protein